MTAPPMAFYAPVVFLQSAYLSRLALADLPASSLDWDALTARVPHDLNEALSKLDREVLKTHPNVTVSSGKTVMRDCLVFAYHTYSVGTAEADAVVVGVTVERDASWITVRGDIANEESGRIHWETEVKSFAGDNERISTEVRKTAAELAARSDAVTKAVASL